MAESHSSRGDLSSLVAVDFDSVIFKQYSSLSCIGNKTLCQTLCDNSYQMLSIFRS